MKRRNTFATFCLATALSIFTVSCSSQDPAAYNNKLMTIMNNQSGNMSEMNAAMMREDYARAESVRKSWSDKLEKSIAEVNDMSTMKDDEGLKAAVEKGLKGYKKMLDEDYKELITLRTKEKAGDANVSARVNLLLNKVNHEFEALGEEINKAGTALKKKISR